MNKTLLIIQREYLSRVREKTFIISTLLFPVLYLLLIFGTGYIAAKSAKNLRVAVIDSSGLFNKAIISQANLSDSIANNLVLKSSKTHGIGSVFQVQAKLNTTWNKIKSERLGIDEKKRARLDNSNISLKAKNLNDENAN